MCGRYTLTAPGEVVQEYFELATAPRLAPRYNIAPTQEAAIVRCADGGRELATARWGLVPAWAADPSIGSRMINARSETAADKRAFRDSLARRRCLVPADGFYEWQRRGGGFRQPVYFHPAAGPLFGFAGLWDRWRGPAGPLESFTILTGPPNELVAPVHDRMPMILPRAAFDAWLDPGVEDPAALAGLLRALPAAEMASHPVATRVNDAAYDAPDCVIPAPEGGNLTLFEL